MLGILRSGETFVMCSEFWTGGIEVDLTSLNYEIQYNNNNHHHHLCYYMSVWTYVWFSFFFTRVT